MEIRAICQNEIDALMSLYNPLNPHNNGINNEAKDSIWKQIENNNNITYLGAFENEKMLASCFIAIIPNFTNNGRPIGYIENVITDEKHRRRGIGKKIIEKAIEIAKENNCFKVFLESGIHRKEAHEFYKKLGFDENSKKSFNIRF